MKRIITGLIAPIALLGLVAACSDDPTSTASKGGATGTTLAPGTTSPGGGSVPVFTFPPGVSFPTGVVTLPPGVTMPTLPPGFTIPPGGFPPGGTVPAQIIDLLMAQLQAAGMKVDRACVETLLDDAAFRKMIETGSTPSSDMIQKFIACFRA
jgi:hypothetical protein